MSEDLGVQLFSVREHLGAELGDTLSKIAAIGYTHIEPYDILTDPDALARAMAESGLKASATHASIQGPRRDDIIASARKLGIGTVIVPWVEPATYDDEKQVEKLAADINDAAAKAAQHGLRVGYHNHDFEFASGMYQAFAERLDDRVILELDCFWSSVGGTDPLVQAPALGERLRYLHVAAGPPEPGKPPLKGGPIRLPEIIAATRASVELVVVEVVTERDVWEVLRENYEYFQGVLA
ncbi:sugar phosphate isomerase/epimerase [Actinoplanes sp. NPDC051411]|jgi:sugar phosphate isomerase/epimerase|uniref:sugar phosphate isomerase/epimerase family protein n=1 Tax=Actinoplanes sp. NPDC051411 TaxID=3155522 RepID=UPI003441969F